MYFLKDKIKKKFRRIDELGRVVPPAEFRSVLHIAPGDELAFWLSGQTIVMQKMKPSCAFCGTTSNLNSFKDSYICKNCLEGIKKEN